MKEHDISAEKVLELIRPYYHGYLGGSTNESDRDTSYESSLEIRTTTTKRGITIPLTLQLTEGGDLCWNLGNHARSWRRNGHISN